MPWGWFYSSGTERLIRIIDQAKYRPILEENLQQAGKASRLRRRFTFQQDDVNVLEQPSQSQELRQIENL